MYLPPKDKQNHCKIEGLKGLPEHYPVPDIDDMLFFIQRNQNTNTVIYKINRNCNNCINTSDPIDIYWKQYNNNREDSPINYIQKKLAYGIEFEMINEDALQLNIISYPQFKIFVTKNDNGCYKAVGKINSVWSELSNVYVFADESGAFPVVKYLEIYGTQIDDRLPCYEKIKI